MDKIRLVFSAIRNNIGKFFLFLLLTILFLVVIFPLDDLGDLVSTQVAKLTRNAIYVRFDRMGISVLPTPGVQFEQVFVETNNLAPLSAQELVLTPSLSALIYQQPFGTFSATGFLKGSVDVKVSRGKKTEEKGLERLELNVDAKKLNLTSIKELLNLPVLLRGQLDLALQNGQIDPTFTEQPDIEVAVKVNKFELPSSNITTQRTGTMTLPELKLSEIILNGRLSAGKLLITKGTIGREGDEIYGTVKYNMDLRVQNMNGMIIPMLGAYNADIDLRISKSFQEKAGFYLVFLDEFKTPTADGAQYRLRISGNNFQAPASMSALR